MEHVYHRTDDESMWASAAAIARAIYSASADKRETICCFLEAHEIGMDPK